MFQKLANFERKVQAKIATRKARKEALKEAKTNYETLVKEIKGSENPAEFLGTNTKSSDKVAEVTKESKTLKEKMESLDNRIIAKPNKKNSNLHLDKGRIDELIEMLKETPTKDLAISTKNGKTRVFLNDPNPLKISRVKKFLKNHGGYEFEVKTP